MLGEKYIYYRPSVKEKQIISDGKTGMFVYGSPTSTGCSAPGKSRSYANGYNSLKKAFLAVVGSALLRPGLTGDQQYLSNLRRQFHSQIPQCDVVSENGDEKIIRIDFW